MSNFYPDNPQNTEPEQNGSASNTPPPPPGYAPPENPGGYQPPTYTGNFYPPQDPNSQKYSSQTQYHQSYYTQYYQTPPPGYQQKSRLGAALVALLFGGMGVHNFYLGYTNRAILQLVMFIIGFIFTLGLLSLGMWIWGFVEGIQLLTYKDNYMYDGNNVILRD